jgi:hypothetical protein
MKQFPTIAVIVALAFAVAMWAYFRYRSEPGPPPSQIAAVVYTVQGEMGNDGPELAEKLALQVPGVIEANFDYVGEQLNLEVLRRVFKEERLREVLQRPGLGWILKPGKPEAAPR